MALDPRVVVVDAVEAELEDDVGLRVERCVWRLRPVEQLLEWARDAGYEPATVEADRFDIYRVVRLVREDEAA